MHIVAHNQVDLEGFSILSKKTPIIDLKPGLEDIFKRFNANTRNQINKTDKIKELIFKNLDNDFDQVYKLHKSFDLARGWMPSPKKEIIESKIFSAYFNNLPISVIRCYGDDKILRIQKLFSVRMKNQKKRIKDIVIGYATRRLVFEMCKYGKTIGYEKLDLCGINFDDPKKAGITKFKQSFGGEIIENYIYRYSNISFKFVKKILKLFNIDIY